MTGLDISLLGLFVIIPLIMLTFLVIDVTFEMKKIESKR
jgi:hypothetical protein